jgi:hypothetical protein
LTAQLVCGYTSTNIAAAAGLTGRRRFLAFKEGYHDK